MSFRRTSKELHATPKAQNTDETEMPLSKTTVVGSGHSSSKRRVMTGLGLLMCSVFALAGFYLYNRHDNRSYQVGEHSFSERNVKDFAGILAKNGSPDGTYDDAKRRYILLSALKSEADQRGISYGATEIDAFLQDTYRRQGGKDKYLAYMQSQYGWSQEYVTLHQTTEYLKTKLENDLLSKRSYSSVFVRWDSINLFYQDEAKAKELYDNRLGILNNFFLPLFEQGASNEEIAKLADVVDGLPEDEGNKIFMQKQGAPIYFKTWTPEQQIAVNASLKHEEGDDLSEKLRTLKVVGEFTGPLKANNGMLIIVRLDSSTGGAYIDWVHYTTEQAKRADIPGVADDSGEKITFTIKGTSTSSMVNFLKARG